MWWCNQAVRVRYFLRFGRSMFDFEEYLQTKIKYFWYLPAIHIKTLQIVLENLERAKKGQI